MATQIGSILNRATRDADKPLRILCAPTHERYESNLAKTGHLFYAVSGPNIKSWNTNYARKPSNYILIEDNELPLGVEFDLVLSQQKFGQYQLLSPLARRLNLPLVSLEHTLPRKVWGRNLRNQLLQMQGNVNVFISDYSRDEWGFVKQPGTIVIPHGVDTSLFSPGRIPKKEHILSVVNDWINRDEPCGFQVWAEATQGLPVHPVGDTPGLSQPAGNVQELVRFYRQARVFINTSLVSPIPTALLEAMSCGCAVVSTATCAIPEVIQHGKNGFLAKSIEELREYCELLLKDKELGEKLGQEARKTIVDRYSLEAFVRNWDRTFRQVAEFSRA